MKEDEDLPVEDDSEENAAVAEQPDEGDDEVELGDSVMHLFIIGKRLEVELGEEVVGVVEPSGIHFETAIVALSPDKDRLMQMLQLNQQFGQSLC